MSKSVSNPANKNSECPSLKAAYGRSPQGSQPPRPAVVKEHTTFVFLIVLTGIALCFSYVLIAPFLRAIVFSAVLVMVFYPVYIHTARLIRNRNTAAALATTVLIMVIASASIFLGRALIAGLYGIYGSLTGVRTGNERFSVVFFQFLDQAIAWINRYSPVAVPDLQAAISSQLEKAVSALLAISAGLVQSLSAFGFHAFIAIVVTFFLFRDGRSMLRRISVILPLKPHQTQRLFTRVKDTLDAIVYGTLAMATMQGALTGVAFWFLGLTSPVLWGLIATLLAVLPIVGTACVWGPAACLLFFSGDWIKGIILVIWGLVVVHPVDNILRPYLIGSRIKVSVLYVFFAVVGGLKAFGLLGLFIGPLILAVTVALLTFVREERHAGRWNSSPPFAAGEETFHGMSAPIART